MKTHLTPFQLFFLTFLYVFSGLSLADVDSLFALILPFAAILLWAVIGYRGAEKQSRSLSDFVSAYMPKRETPIPLALFFLTVAAEAVLLLMQVGTVLTREADFIPFPLILAVVIGIAILTAKQGMTVLGRFAELSLGLLIPVLLVHVFGRFTPIALTGHFSGIALVFSVMPSPIFFLLSMTTVSGDEGTSDGFRSTGRAPRDRAGFLIKTVIGGAGFAVLARAFLLMFPFGEHELLVYFLAYMAHTVKLSILFSLLAHGGRKGNTRFAVWYVLLMITGGMLTVATVGGAVFSPFLWMILLVSLNLTASAMLGLFAVR